MRSGERGISFIHDGTVHEAISRLAARQSVVLFAGAGVTIDQTTVSWKILTQLLLTEKVELANFHLISKQAAIALASELAATRTGLASAGDDEHEQQITPSRGHLPFRWAHEGARLESMRVFRSSQASIAQSTVDRPWQRLAPTESKN